MRYFPALALLMPVPALAQDGVTLEAAIVSDHRERGLSWSGGKAAAQIRIDAPLPAGFAASVTAATTRNAARHSGADGAAEIGLRYAGSEGLLQWHGGVTAHLFAGAEGSRDYAEAELGAGATLGPVELSLLGSYAPPQDAIGGSNLYARARAQVALTGTPVTLSAHLGRSVGSRRGALVAERLRPGGDYRDWRLGADYVVGPFTLSLAYSDTDIGRRPGPASRHHGAAVVAGAQISL